MGVKPFIYYCSDCVFVFASEIKAILKVPSVPRRLNELKVAEYLVKDFEDRSITFYQDILRLPPARYVDIDVQGVQNERYWRPDLSGFLNLSSEDEYVEAFREQFSRAVRCRLRSAFPIGSMLSGGLDSSSIVGMAGHLLANENGRSLHTFSAIFPSLAETDPRIDERSFIDSVLATGNFEPHYVRADHLSPNFDMLWNDDEAIPAPNLYMDNAIFEAANQNGVRNILSGFDGDSAVSYGYELLPELIRNFKWRTFVSESTDLARSIGVSRKRLIWYLGIMPIIPGPAIDIYNTMKSRSMPWDDDVVINPNFANKIGIAKRMKFREKSSQDRIKTVRDQHWYSLSSGLLLYALELLDKSASLNLIEVRYPFFDRRFIQFCLTIPPEQKLHKGVSRVVARRAMGSVLPQQVLLRTKKGNLSANFKSKLFEIEDDFMKSLIEDDLSKVEDYVDVNALRQVYYRFQSEPKKSDQDALTLFMVAILKRWLNEQKRVL
jgi:asparagine synthase (glutamine-hydrolysing)